MLTARCNFDGGTVSRIAGRGGDARHWVYVAFAVTNEIEMHRES